MSYTPEQISQKTMANSEPVVIASDQSAVPVSGTFWQNTQPVSGTVTVQQATAANLKVDLSGTAANATALKVDGSAVTQPVSGTFWQNTQPISGTVTVQQSTASSLKVDLSGTAANATAIKVDGSAVTQPVSISGNQAVNVAQINGVTPLMGNGLTGTGSPRVTIASDNTAFSVNAVQSGTWTVQPGNTANTTAWKVDNSAVNQPVVGNVASGSSDSGNPVKIGAVGHTANPTAVTDGQRVNAFADKLGRLVVTPNQCRDLVAVQQSTITASTSETTIVTAIASTFADLLNLTITNSSATATLVTLKDSTGGTTRGIYSIPAGGGLVVNFATPLPQATVNNNWTITCGTSVSSIYVVAQYAKNV